MEVHRYDLEVELHALVRETRAWPSGAGTGDAARTDIRCRCRRHRQLHPNARYRYENYPCLGVLEQLPALHSGLRRFRVPRRSSFRLMRREPGSAYDLAHRPPQGSSSDVRSQIPLVSNGSDVPGDYRLLGGGRDPAATRAVPLDEGVLRSVRGRGRGPLRPKPARARTAALLRHEPGPHTRERRFKQGRVSSCSHSTWW